MTNIPDFSDEKSRQKWFIENAEYFTVIRRVGGQNLRAETVTLKHAEHLARCILISTPDARVLIYAVHGASDTYVKTISMESLT